MLPIDNNLVVVLTDYLEARNSTADFSEETIEKRLASMGKSVEQIHELLIEFNDEWEKEQLATVRLKKSKKALIFSILAVVLIGVVLVITARYGFFNGKRQFVVFIFMGAVLLIAFNAYTEIRKEKKRKVRWFIKWENWA